MDIGDYDDDDLAEQFPVMEGHEPEVMRRKVFLSMIKPMFNFYQIMPE